MTSTDPDLAPGTVTGYTLCESTREASVMPKADLADVGCEKCREALARTLAEKRRAARRRTA